MTVPLETTARVHKNKQRQRALSDFLTAFTLSERIKFNYIQAIYRRFAKKNTQHKYVTRII